MRNVAVIWLLWPGLWLFAQSPTFTSRADLVLVPVHARSKGQHVSGLTKDSFTLLQDGQVQKIAVFEEVRTTTERLTPVATGPGEFTNELQGNPNTARYTIIAIDRINTTTMDMARLREGLLKFLAQATDSGEPIRLVAVHLNGIEIIQDFTSDPKLLAAALQRIHSSGGQLGSPSAPMFNASVLEMGLTDQAQSLSAALDDHVKEGEQRRMAFQEAVFRTNSLESLQEIALSLSGLPGRKSVVWASSGYPFAGLASAFGKGPGSMLAQANGLNSLGTIYDVSGLDEYTMHLLNTANIAMYPVDARGTVNTGWQVMEPNRPNAPSYIEKESARYQNADAITTFEHIAQSTGGKPCYGRTDLSGCFKDALDDARDHYLLGYYINAKKLAPGWHKINVKVADKDVSVRSRSGFVLPTFTPEQTTVAEVRAELKSSLLAPGLPLRGRWTGTTPKGDKRTVTFSLLIPNTAAVALPSQNHLNLEVGTIARKQDGAIAAQVFQHLERNLPPESVAIVQTSGISYKNSLELPSGKYLVRFVVRDNTTGRIGSLSTMLAVE